MKGNLTQGKLLNEKGHLAQAGWSTKNILEYSRADITASRWSIKEWDYYYIGNANYGLALTVAENSYMSLVSASWLDFTKPSYKTTSEIKFFTFGKNVMPSSPYEGDVIYNTKRVSMNFIRDERRQLTCKFDNFIDGKTLVANILLTNFPQEEISIATPWEENKKAFYYNNKTNCMTASGYVTIGDERYEFSPSDTLGTLDWGRGVWTYRNTWYWGSMSTYVDGHKFGFNIGYGFGDRSTGTENMLFYDGIAHKLDQVIFEIPTKDDKDDYMSPWHFTSNDGRFEMEFTPIIDRVDCTNALIIESRQHQVFGKFNGKAILDDGTVITLRDHVGFAEKVFNRW